MSSTAGKSAWMVDDELLRVSWGLSPKPDETERKRWEKIYSVLLQRAERLRALSSSAPFHARKVAKILAEGGNEMDYWIGLVGQRVELPAEPD